MRSIITKSLSPAIFEILASKCIGVSRCGDMVIRLSWGIWNPHFGGRGGRRGPA